jgi:hypothetical protein
MSSLPPHHAPRFDAAEAGAGGARDLDPALAHELVRQLVQTGLGLSTIAEVLLDALPEDAFPGEEPAQVLLEMLAGTVAPVAGTVGPEVVEAATVFLRAVHERVEDEIRALVVLAREREAGRA